MSELTDLQICRKIAEIEGFETWVSDEGCTYEELHINHGGTYSPLTDDGLCFRLMVKYGVSVSYNPGSNSVAECFSLDDEDGEVSCYGCDDNPSKAICLAIIEAHK